MRREAVFGEMCLHLDEMYEEKVILLFSGDDIDLSDVCVEISFEDLEVMIFEEPEGEVFGGATVSSGDGMEIEVDV